MSLNVSFEGLSFENETQEMNSNRRFLFFLLFHIFDFLGAPKGSSWDPWGYLRHVESDSGH